MTDDIFVKSKEEKTEPKVEPAWMKEARDTRIMISSTTSDVMQVVASTGSVKRSVAHFERQMSLGSEKK